MRCINRHTAAIDGVAPGASGDFDPHSPSVRALCAEKLLEPCEGETSLEPTANELRASVLDANSEIEKLHAVIDGLRKELDENRAAATKSASALQGSIDELVNQLREADSKAANAAAERDGVLSELNALRAQLAAKAEPDPAKKGKG